MRDEIKTLLQTDFLTFARKGMRELDGTRMSNDRYLDYLATHLQNVADGKTLRLVINMPARHLKTLLGAVCLSAWLLANSPDTKILIVTYCEPLARDISRDIRSILKAPWFREVFATRIAKDHGSVMDFATTAGGGVHAASIDGTVTGFGADVIIVDDIHDLKEAGRPGLLRDTVDKFYKNVVPRLNKPNKGRIVAIGHRIHENDLSAHLLTKRDWTAVVLPLVATRDQTYETADGPWRRRKGELLRPDDLDESYVEEMREELVNPSFDMFCQQDVDGQALPAVKAEHFPSYAPATIYGLPCMISVDAATGPGEEKSYSVVQVWAYDAKNIYLADQYRERADFKTLGEAIHRLAKKHRVGAIVIEKAAYGTALVSELTRRQKRRVVGITARGSKAARLRPHLETIVARRVHLPLGADFNEPFVREIVRFPSGRYADQVDAFSQAMDWIDQNGQSKSGAPDKSVGMAVAYGSQYNGFRAPAAPPNAPGTMVVGSNSNRMPNGPFIAVTAWVHR